MSVYNPRDYLCMYAVWTRRCMQASERGPLVQQVLQEGPHVLMHFLRVALWNPVSHVWQYVSLQSARHKAAADGPHQPLVEVRVLLSPQQQGGSGQLLGLQGEVPVAKIDRQAERWLPTPIPCPTNSPELLPGSGLT